MTKLIIAVILLKPTDKYDLIAANILNNDLMMFSAPQYNLNRTECTGGLKPIELGRLVRNGICLVDLSNERIGFHLTIPYGMDALSSCHNNATRVFQLS